MCFEHNSPVFVFCRYRPHSNHTFECSATCLPLPNLKYTIQKPKTENSLETHTQLIGSNVVFKRLIT